MQRCLICNEKFNEKPDLYDHYEDEHSSEFEKGMTGAQMHFFKSHGRITGKCIMCGKTTKWNDSTNLPNRFCDDPKCRENYRQMFVSRMKHKYGKTHLLNDPEVQKKMLFNRKISGKYKWSDGVEKQYVGSYELDFLQFLDKFYGFKSSDVMTPAPQIIDYKYQGKSHFYIPDVYIASLNLVVEIKDGGSNPNTHPKIMAVDKVKEKLKDEAIKKSGVNYIKVTDKKYGSFVDFLNNLKVEEIQIGKSKSNNKVPETLSESFLNEKALASKDNYLIVPDVTFIFNTNSNSGELYCANLALLLSGKNRMICFFNGNDGGYMREFDYNEIFFITNPHVKIYEIEKNGKDLYTIANSLDTFNFNIYDEVLYNILIEYYDEYSEGQFNDIYDLIYRSNKFNKVYDGKISSFINRMDYIEEESSNKTLNEYFLLKNKSIFNENLNNNLNMGGEAEGAEAELLKEMEIDNKKRDEIERTIKYHTGVGEYIKLIDNAYRVPQIEILEHKVANDSKINQEDKIEILRLSSIKRRQIDLINKDEMNITILPIKIKQSIPLNTLKKFTIETDNSLDKYDNLIKNGTFTEINGQRDGIDYLRTLRIAADKISQKSTNTSSLNENILYKYYLGIGDM